MATKTLGADSARVIPFTTRNSRRRAVWPADLPMFDHGNEAHVRAWRTMIEFGRLERQKLELLTEAALDRLDQIDGDTDVEANGDELDGHNSEDEFKHHSLWQGGAGCPISDPPENEHDREAIDEREPDDGY